MASPWDMQWPYGTYFQHLFEMLLNFLIHTGWNMLITLLKQGVILKKWNSFFLEQNSGCIYRQAFIHYCGLHQVHQVLNPYHYVDCHYQLFHLLTVKGYWLQSSVASVLQLTAAQFACSTLWYHLSSLPELISLRHPPWVSPLALTQPFHCCELRIYFPCVIIQGINGIVQFLARPMKTTIP